MKTLRIFNPRTKRKEEFKTTDRKAGVYVCGITPYDITHLGHAFTYTFFDVLLRYLRYIGYQATYVQNLTDIDDDIIKKSKELNKNWRKLGEENAQKFLQDMKWLNNEQPDAYPKATDHIRGIQEMIKVLLKRGVAYAKHGSVYFSIAKDKSYGKLSGLSRNRMLPIANQRGNDPKDPNKRDSLDFMLWQARKKGEPFWNSPWGTGRPGWHIECSVMSTSYLGDTVDIHGGGSDLIFPHHESEIAQSEAATGKRFVRHWMHTGMLKYKGEKMSKSLGNLVLIRNLKKKYSANAIRMYLLSHHYRSVFEFYEKNLKGAQQREELFKKVWRLQSQTGSSLNISEYREEFHKAMNDDMNTPQALKTMERLAKRILKEKEKNITAAKAFLNIAFGIMGLTIEYQ
ncbi:MAG: cysteine--tRNA ligase [Parcubacteria group bacterium]|nr:cysteine--tRNA ligase [Parcubacteria group bacterium]